MIKKRFLAFVLAFVMVFGLLAVPATANTDDPVLIILHTNDIHGQFVSTATAIGHDVIAAIADDMRATHGDIVVLLDAGDAIHGTFFTNQTTGEAAIEIMNAVGYDALVMGNHEFNFGWDRLQELAVMADFPFLLQDDITEGAPGFAEYTLIERNGMTVGVFGLTTLETAFKSGGAMAMDRDWGTVEGQIDYAQGHADALRAAGADFVIALAHLGTDDMGYGTSSGIRDNTTGIDLIVDGHSHDPLDRIDQAPGAKIVSAHGSGNTLGVVYVFADGSMYAYSIPKADTLDITPQAATTAVIDRWDEALAEVRNEVVTYSPYTFYIDRTFERVGGTIKGNITADAMRAATGAEIVITNGGGIRDSVLPAGPINIGQLFTTHAFEGYFWTAYVKGSVIVEALEHGVHLYPVMHGGFPQVSGISFAFDPSLPPGARVSDVRIGGEPIDLDREYTMTTGSFMATGGDGYTMLIESFELQNQLIPRYPHLAASFQTTMVWYLRDYNPNAWTNELDERINIIGKFSDLNPQQNALVAELVEAGIIQGFADGLFRPRHTLSRAQAAAMLTRHLDLPVTGDIPFTDVVEDDWFADYARATAAAGIFQGFADGTFGGDVRLTVSQLAVLIERIENPDAIIGTDYTIITRIATAEAFAALLG